MKGFSLLPQVALVCVVAYACSDSTAISDALVAVNQREGVVGRPPPPPISTAVTISVSPSTSLAVNSAAAGTVFASAPFTGTYFSNGSVDGSATAAAEVGDPTLAFNGTAWLRLDNVQPTTVGTASANARFKAQDSKFTGMGTLMIEGHTIVITSVELFVPQPDCGAPGQICAHIEFTATVDGIPGQSGHADAFDKEFCTLSFPSEGDPFFICGSG